MIAINIIKSRRDVVAVCDFELIGKVIEEGKFRLEVKENFFLGKQVSEKEAISLMERMAIEDATFYIVGKEAVDCALKAQLIVEEDVKVVQDVPLVLILL
jgi:uncharacterized protein